MRRSSQRPSDPAYYIEDCRIYELELEDMKRTSVSEEQAKPIFSKIVPTKEDQFYGRV